jgi:hypothetical protein
MAIAGRLGRRRARRLAEWKRVVVWIVVRRQGARGAEARQQPQVLAVRQQLHCCRQSVETDLAVTR